MLLPDPSIDVASLAALLRSEFDTEADLSFVPVGGDSWNYRAGPWWVSVRRDSQGHFPGNYEAARQLREAGEPAPSNVIVSTEGQLLLLDWGDLLWAPLERDTLGLAELGVEIPGRRHVKRFYELRWALGEVAEYVARLTDPHEGTAEDAEKRLELARYLS